MARQPGFFDVDERYAALSAAGDPLERLAAVVEFELFRPELDVALDRPGRWWAMCPHGWADTSMFAHLKWCPTCRREIEP